MNVSTERPRAITIGLSPITHPIRALYLGALAPAVNEQTQRHCGALGSTNRQGVPLRSLRYRIALPGASQRVDVT